MFNPKRKGNVKLESLLTKGNLLNRITRDMVVKHLTQSSSQFRFLVIDNEEIKKRALLRLWLWECKIFKLPALFQELLGRYSKRMNGSLQLCSVSARRSANCVIVTFTKVEGGKWVAIHRQTFN
ncbi:MAG: hypothetical protein ACPGO5_00445 [Patescibacteria group bacterium]